MGKLATFVQRKPWRTLSGTALKWIAVVTMLVDHLGAILVWSYYLTLVQSGATNAHDVYQIYLWMRRIGRMAFPIFCFVLVEGFTHTHSRPKYALRLLLFGLISEVPYDFALHDEISYTSELNIMFTLLLAFCALWLADALGKLICKGIAKARKQDAVSERTLSTVNTLCAIVTILAAAALAEGPLDVSYHGYGIVLIGVLYIARNHRFMQFVLGTLATMWYCYVHGSTLQMFALLGLAVLCLYDGTRGRGMKYFFYVFYPAHLLILGLINMWLF